MQKAVSDFCFGLWFGCGFLVAYGVLRLIVTVLGGAHSPFFAG